MLQRTRLDNLNKSQKHTDCRSTHLFIGSSQAPPTPVPAAVPFPPTPHFLVRLALVHATPAIPAPRNAIAPAAAVCGVAVGAERRWVLSGRLS